MLQHPKLPFVRIAFSILSGILIEYQFSLGLFGWMIVSSLSLATILLFQKKGASLKWKYKYLLGCCLHVLLVSAGAFSTISDAAKNFPTTNIEDHKWMIIQLRSDATQTQNGNRFEAAIYTIENQQKRFAGNCFLYINGIHADSFQHNDLLISINKLNKILPKKNPFTFDFYEYAHRKKINYTLHLYTLQFLKIGKVNSKLQIITRKLRNYFLQTLRKHIPNPMICGLAEAMLTGYRDNLNKELLEAYTDTGVVHIIAISGLHLGLIFWLASFILQKSIPRKWFPIISLTTILPMLWIFSFMTGSSASVLRSVIMFSLSIAATTFGKRNNNLNALMASGVLLLIHDPGYVFDIGFQLSYAAVASILLFEKKIRNIFYLKNKAAVYGWSMVSVTVAAQIITTPFVIYHFHRFPILFLFSNLIAVPLSSIILLLEIGLCFGDIIGIGAEHLGQLINFLTACMNNYVETMHNIPFNLISEIYMSRLSIFLFSITLFSLFYLIFSYNKINLFNTLLLLLVSTSMIVSKKLIEPVKKDWTVLHIPEKTCIIHRHGQSIRILYKKNGIEDISLIRRKLQIAINFLQPNKIIWQILPESPCLIELKCPKQEKSNRVVLISAASSVELRSISGISIQETMVIADGTHKLWKIKEWEKEAHELNLRFLSTSLTGSVTIDCQ